VLVLHTRKADTKTGGRARRRGSVLAKRGGEALLVCVFAGDDGERALVPPPTLDSDAQARPRAPMRCLASRLDLGPRGVVMH
jgi:hypothetical protein